MLDVTRTEKKYEIDLRQSADMKRRLGIFMENDPHNGDRGYLVRSLYFDTLHDADFEQKVEGYDERLKIRLRVYGAGDETVKLEVKEKTDAFQRKRSLPLTREEALRMVNADYRFLLQRQEAMAQWLYSYLSVHCYRPKCIVDYDRYALIAACNDTRITFDGNLRASEADFDLFDENLALYPVAPSGMVTLEVKYTGFLLTYLKNELSSCSRMQTSNSKYCAARMISKRGRR